MKQSELKKNRDCEICGRTFWATAKEMLDHEDYHTMARRAAKSGLVLPPEQRIER